MRGFVPIAVALSVAALSAVVVAKTRARLVPEFKELRVKNDVYALPSPEQTIVMSLGYRSALADILLAHMFVSYGIHFQEKRRFEFAGQYLDTINALDPKFRTPYRFADSFLILQPVNPRIEDYKKAREILERGMKERPYDTDVHLIAGQYMAYLAAPNLPKEMQKEWHQAGARALARTCELIGKNEHVPYHCVTAAQLFTRTGNREAAIRFLERVLHLTDDPEIRELASGYLGKVWSEDARERAMQRLQRMEEIWKEDLWFVSKDLYLVLGPPVDTAKCAGVPPPDEPECKTTWQARFAEDDALIER